MTAQTVKAQEIAAAAPLIDPPPRTLAAALVAALAELTVIEKGHTANAGSYSYDYADIADVVRLTRPRLAQHGLVALTPIHEHNGGLACTVTILHTSGERLDLGPFPFPHGRDAQATGSMVTYHRRYALIAALGLATGDDDDGARAAARTVVWNAGMVKAALVEILGDKEQARDAWVLANGDDLTVWSRQVAERIADEWLNQPAEGEVAP